MSLAREHIKELRHLRGIALAGEFTEDPETGELGYRKDIRLLFSADEEDFTGGPDLSEWDRKARRWLPALRQAQNIIFWFICIGASLATWSLLVIAIWRVFKGNH